MTAGTFCSLPIGIPVTVSTMKNLVVNSFLSFVLSLFCSLKDGGNLRRFFSIWSHPQTNVRNHFPPVFEFAALGWFFFFIIDFDRSFGIHFTLYKLESLCLITCSRHQSLQIFEFQASKSLKSLFLFIEGGQENIFHWAKKYFRPIKNVFLSPFNK